ncbi:MAG TPA: EamA family transporter [Candidatus Saccharimonadales bacterium]
MFAALFAVNSRSLALKFKNATLPLNLSIFFAFSMSAILYDKYLGFNTVNIQLFDKYLGLFILAGACFAVTNILSYIVFEYVDAAVASLFSTLNIIASVVLSTLIIHEGLSLTQIIGAAILIFSIQLIVSINVSRKKHKQIGKAIILSILAAAFFSTATVTEKYLLGKVNLPTYLTFGWGFQFLGVITIAILFSRRINANFGLFKNMLFWKLALPAVLLRVLGGLLYILSLRISNNLSLISVVSGLKIILAALLAAVILKEKDFLKRKLEAAFTSSIGIALIFWK